MWHPAIQLMVFPAPVAISHTNQKDGDPGIGCGVPGDNTSLARGEENLAQAGERWSHSPSDHGTTLYFFDASCYVRGTYLSAARPRRQGWHILPRVRVCRSFRGSAARRVLTQEPHGHLSCCFPRGCSGNFLVSTKVVRAKIRFRLGTRLVHLMRN